MRLQGSLHFTKPQLQVYMQLQSLHVIWGSEQSLTSASGCGVETVSPLLYGDSS